MTPCPAAGGCPIPNGVQCPTHSCVYAHDIGTVCEKHILASRGGRVAWLMESNSAQMWGDCGPACPGHVCCPAGTNCQGNSLWIQHQDGTVGTYSHMPLGGIGPALDDVVRRGEFIGIVGTTGNSSGPHLHWESRESLQGGSRLELFQAMSSPLYPAKALSCYEPKPGDVLGSTNKEQ
jgi:murein DD-endopeptidase MepM/ murein hydrolase activator NlpD